MNRREEEIERYRKALLAVSSVLLGYPTKIPLSTSDENEFRNSLLPTEGLYSKWFTQSDRNRLRQDEPFSGWAKYLISPLELLVW